MFRAAHARTHLFQIVFSKGNTTTYPMTRDFLYKDPARLVEAASAVAPPRRFGHG
jgi:hypothetical protein